jgi:flavin reductase (DIM6/NTAB) family NADH-FMN oxidoreductase RutF
MSVAPVEKVPIDSANWDCIIAPTSLLVVITTTDREGRVNAASYGSCVRVCHDPVNLAFSSTQGTDTHDNIMATGEFVVNLVPFDQRMLEKVLQIGLPWKRGINELDQVGLTAIDSTTVRPPRIAECYAHFELKVLWTHPWLHRRMVCGEVTAVSANADCIDENQMVIWPKARPAHYCGGRYMDQFVPANEPLRVDWDWRELAAKGVSQASFRGPEQGVDSPDGLMPAADWRDMLRSGPHR